MRDIGLSLPGLEIFSEGGDNQLALFDGSPRPSDDRPEWSEEDIVRLHWRLLQELAHLPQPETPLEEKIDTLNWVFTDPHKDRLPFSFANCLRVVGLSPLSPTEYFGALDIEAIRDWIRVNAARWMRSTIERYPDWVREEIAADPDRVAREIDRNPQWINEQVRHRARRDDFLALSA
jgi:hypothetical protein